MPSPNPLASRSSSRAKISGKPMFFLLSRLVKIALTIVNHQLYSFSQTTAGGRTRPPVFIFPGRSPHVISPLQSAVTSQIASKSFRMCRSVKPPEGRGALDLMKYRGKGAASDERGNSLNFGSQGAILHDLGGFCAN